jgi:hypothetical protein
MLYVICQLDEIRPGVVYVHVPRPAARRRHDNWYVDDLLRQRRYERLCELIVQKLENT